MAATASWFRLARKLTPPESKMSPFSSPWTPRLSPPARAGQAVRLGPPTPGKVLPPRQRARRDTGPSPPGARDVATRREPRLAGALRRGAAPPLIRGTHPTERRHAD